MFQSDAGRTACTRPSGAAAWPLVIEGQRLPRKVFRRSIALLSDSLSTLRRAGYPTTTQDSLPVAGQALLDGLSTRKLPMKGFKFVIYISLPFLKLTWRKRCNRSLEKAGSLKPLTEVSGPLGALARVDVTANSEIGFCGSGRGLRRPRITIWISRAYSPSPSYFEPACQGSGSSNSIRSTLRLIQLKFGFFEQQIADQPVVPR